MVYPILKFFEYEHLPERLKPISRSFFDLAYFLVGQLSEGEELHYSLRKLLEAKDCAVRAALE